MNFEKTLTINLGNYESLKLGVKEAESFEQCDYELDKELLRLGLPVKKGIKV